MGVRTLCRVNPVDKACSLKADNAKAVSGTDVVGSRYPGAGCLTQTQKKVVAVLATTPSSCRGTG